MTITPIDIQNKEFERSFRGYDIEDVDEFLDRVAKDLEQLMRENMELKDQINHLLEKNKNYQKLEGTMHNAIVVAQETADDVKQAAKREAELIKREAESEARQLIEEARYRSTKILSEREDLFKQVQVFKMRFRSFIEAQLATLENEALLEEPRDEKPAVRAQNSYEPQPKQVPQFEPMPRVEPKPHPEPEPHVEPKPQPPGSVSDLEPEPDFDVFSDHDSEQDPEF